MDLIIPKKLIWKVNDMKRWIALVIIALMMATALGCGGGGGQVSSGTSAVKISIAGLNRTMARSLMSSQKRTAASVANIVITISAPDMQTITDTIPVSGGDTVSRTYVVQNGSNRHFLAVALAGDGSVLYQGDAFADLNGGNPTVNIQMGVDITGEWTLTTTGQDGMPDTGFVTFTQIGNSVAFSLDLSQGSATGNGTSTGNDLQLTVTGTDCGNALNASFAGSFFADGSFSGTFTATGGCGNDSGTWSMVRGHIVVTPLTVQPGSQTVDGGTGGTASFSISGGTAPYTISSDNPSFPPSPATVAAGGGTFAVTVPAGTSAVTVTYTVRDNAGGSATATLVVSAVAPPISVTGTWEFHFRCAGAGTDAVVTNLSLNEASGGTFTGSGSGTDYNGTPMNVDITGSYTSSTHLLTGDITSTFQGNSCVREDTFSVTLQSNDTGYVDTTQVQVCGCPAQVRLLKLN